MSKNKNPIIGYKYYLGMHMVVCLKVDALLKIIVGEKEAWSGNVTNSQQIYINKPGLFGGDKKEGGIEGAVDIMFGESTQPKNSYLIAKIGELIPAFRGVFSVVLRHCYVVAMSSYPKPWAFKVRRMPAKGWYDAKANINGSANFAHIIYEAITDTEYGLGYSAVANVDDASFRAAADTLYTEGLGGSGLLVQQDSAENFIYQMLGHCNGMLYCKPDTGKFAIKLLRADYNSATLPSFNESNIITLESFERAAYADVTSEVVVKYRPQGSLQDDTVTVQNLAVVQAQEGISSQNAEYPFIDSAANANRLAMRDLTQKSTPLARVTLHVNRTAWNLLIGECFKFSWQAFSITDVIFRVMAINYGSRDDGTIVITAVEDIFGLSQGSYVAEQPSLWVDPIQPPAAVTNRRLEDTSYFDLEGILDSYEFDNLQTADSYLTAYAAEPASQYVQSFELWDKPSGGAYAFAASDEVCPNGTLVASISETATSFTINNMTPGCSFIEVGTYALIENERVRVDTFNPTTGAMTVGRGILDTVPAKHSAGVRVWFGEDNAAIDPDLRASGATMNVKMLPRTSIGLLDIASAPEDTYTFVGRASRPYAPGSFKLNGAFYPTEIGGAVTVSWAHRDRTLQNVRPFVDHTASNIGPEAGVTYSWRLLRLDTNAVVESGSGLTGTSVALTATYRGNVRVEVWSVRAGLESYQRQRADFNWLNATRITEAGDARITETGDTRLLEY